MNGLLFDSVFIFSIIFFLLDNLFNYILLLFWFIIIYHIFLYFFKDRRYLAHFKEFKDPDNVTIEDLSFLPLINIIIPAWKEGRDFYDCLTSIINLKYPKIKVIVNAGGNEETIQYADSFKKYPNFIILRQVGGKSSATLGKIKALNDCLEYISEGIAYFIDADCYITDEILLRMIIPIVNNCESVVMSSYRPLKSQENKDFVKYLQFNRLGDFKSKFSRYSVSIVSGSNTCMKYEIIKSIGRFTENRLVAEDISRGLDISFKGFKTYCLSDYRSRMYSAYPKGIKEYIEQRKRYFEDSMLLAFRNKKLSYFLKFLLIIIGSLFLLLLPLFIVINFTLFFLDLAIFMNIYLLKIRKMLFFKNAVKGQINVKFRIMMFFKMFYYIFIDILVNIFTFFNLISFIKKIKKETSEK